MQVVSKSALKARMLEYFRRIEETGEELTVTDNGVPVLPVLRISPILERQPASITFADVRGKVRYHEDPVLPTDEEWPET